MKSKTSFFNATLYKKNLTRYWPLWGLSAFFAAMIPLSGIMIRLNHSLNVNAAEFAQAYYSVVAYAAPPVLLFYSILCAMAVWSYLYNARSVGMMHTLPIRREGLFVTNFLSGLTMVAIPWTAAGLLTVILSLMCGAFSAGPLFLTVLCVFCEGLFYFCTATAAAFLTGNAFALFGLYFLFHFLAAMLDFLITTFSSNMVFGLWSRAYTGVVQWLSPTLYLINHVRPKAVYVQVPEPGHPDVTFSQLQSVTLENAWLIALYALAGLALLGVAYALYRYRKSECAGEVIAMSWGRPVFRYGIAALTALGGGQLMYVVLFRDLDDTSYRIFPLICCMTIAGLIGYYGASMLIAKTLRVFKGSRRQTAIIAAGCALLCCVVGFDLLGIARRVPSVDSVNYVRLYAANNTYYLFPDTDAAVIEQLRDVHRTIIKNKDEIRKQFKNDPAETDFSRYTYATVRVNYYLKNGLSVDRNYRMYLSKERMEEPGTYENALDGFINSTEMKFRRLRYNDPRFQPVSGNISILARDDGFEFSSRELKEVLHAVSEDAKAGAWGTFDWFDNDDSSYAVSMFFWFSLEDPAVMDGQPVTDHVNVYLRPGMTNTINCLTKMGYLKDGDLITRTEWQKSLEEKDELSYTMEDWEEIFLPTDAVETESVGVYPSATPEPAVPGAQSVAPPDDSSSS